jgi:multisubunit Na+/H+ antiporter MnhF subunit
VNAFVVAATVLVSGFLPCGFVIVRARPIDAVVALQLSGTLAVLVLLCLAEGFHRTSYLDVPVITAVISPIGVVVFARFIGRWL